VEHSIDRALTRLGTRRAAAGAAALGGRKLGALSWNAEYVGRQVRNGVEFVEDNECVLYW
jgi:hypothetical protein